MMMITRVSRENVALPKKHVLVWGCFFFFFFFFLCVGGGGRERGGVNQCGTKGMVYGCKLNLN